MKVQKKKVLPTTVFKPVFTLCSQICPVTADTDDVSENKMKKKMKGKKWPWLCTMFLIYFKDVHVKWCQYQRRAYTQWRHMKQWGAWFWRRGFSVLSPAHFRHGHNTVHAVFMHLAISITWMQEKEEKPILLLAVAVVESHFASSSSSHQIKMIGWLGWDQATFTCITVLAWIFDERLKEAVYAFTNDHACKLAWLNHLVFVAISPKRHFTKLVIIPLQCKMDQVSLENSFYSQTLATRIQNMSSEFQWTIELLSEAKGSVVREGNRDDGHCYCMYLQSVKELHSL